MRPLMLAVALSSLAPLLAAEKDADPLPSWKDGDAKKRIVEFVRSVTDKSGKDYVRPAERIAVFDNDGTLWCEQPDYVQAVFALDRVKDLAPKNPAWKEKQPFRAVLEGDKKAMAKFGEKDLIQILAATHSGMTTDEFDEIATKWLASAKHPRFGKLYKECVYQPMLELLAYLRQNDFRTFIVSGGGVDFIRCFAEDVYGVPRERVIGSSGKTRFEVDRQGNAKLIKLPELNSLDDGPGKPENIRLHVGRVPILAFGNSDGDLAMLQYTAGGKGKRLMLLLHHDDDRREYAYDRKAKVGRLDKALDEAKKRDWTVVSMKKDFAKVFPFDR
jgi:phosphoglycolate phosphatase-like HAD superfamily hydrolase